ncbi:MAG: alpha/beta hydrolase [Xanthobacteraceae bacterium]|nr:alpha/beta hydrolase [Xanthobacteraceae bacterium]MCW5675728.1 alpha/beta hydrolase [Xanthobacteraceae bacterium]
MATFIVAHGAWSAGWVWKKMHPLMRTKGHELITPTYTGLGERVHLATELIGLETHIRDMLMVLQMEDVRDAILIGHSYGGMVATGVADLAAERISKLVYLDAFVPRHGEGVFDLVSPEERERRLAGVVDGWKLPPSPPPPDTSQRDIDWITPRRVHQPLACFQEPLLLENGEPQMPRAYIYAQRHNPGDPFRPFAERAKREGWQYFEMDASHSPHVTAPEALTEVLDTIARG